MTRLTTALATVGIAALGVGLLGGPAVAASPAGRGSGSGSSDGTCTGTGTTHRPDGAGQGRRAAGAPTGTGTCTTCTATPSGTLTADQRSELATWVQEEKLALDLYTVFAARYDTGPFERIAASETRHLAAVRTLLDTYDITDPSAGVAPGVFTDAELQAMYTTLLAQGTASLDGAMAVGRAVETDDLTLLAETASGITAPDVLRVLSSQTTASERHLAAFGG